jgi:hypothetical protein
VNNQQLNEGLRPLDLQGMIYPIFEIDTFKSKMGEDQDVVVITFQAKDRFPAKDLMEFIEKGYSFVLDADVSSGENSKGEYSIFVEIERTSRLAEQIKELTYGIKKLSGIDDWKFRYYKDKSVHEATEENIKKIVPSSARMYESTVNKFKTEEVKSFFNKTLMDDLTIDDSVITIHKPFNQKIQLRWLSEDDPQAVVESVPSVDDSSTAEIFWLTKVLGDYDISKFGDKLLFTNGDKAMLLQRTDK